MKQAYKNVYLLLYSDITCLVVFIAISINISTLHNHRRRSSVGNGRGLGLWVYCGSRNETPRDHHLTGSFDPVWFRPSAVSLCASCGDVDSEVFVSEQ